MEITFVKSSLLSLSYPPFSMGKIGLTADSHHHPEDLCEATPHAVELEGSIPTHMSSSDAGPQAFFQEFSGNNVQSCWKCQCLILSSFCWIILEGFP